MMNYILLGAVISLVTTTTAQINKDTSNNYQLPVVTPSYNLVGWPSNSPYVLTNPGSNQNIFSTGSFTWQNPSYTSQGYQNANPWVLQYGLDRQINSPVTLYPSLNQGQVHSLSYVAGGGYSQGQNNQQKTGIEALSVGYPIGYYRQMPLAVTGNVNSGMIGLTQPGLGGISQGIVNTGGQNVFGGIGLGSVVGGFVPGTFGGSFPSSLGQGSFGGYIPGILPGHGHGPIGGHAPGPFGSYAPGSIGVPSPVIGGSPGTFNGGYLPGMAHGGFPTGTLTGAYSPGSLVGGYAPGTLTGGYAPGSLTGGYAPGSLTGGYAPGSLTGGYAPGSLTGGYTPVSFTGGYAPGSLVGGYATGSPTGGYAPGSLINNHAPGSHFGGYAPGSIIGGNGQGMFGGYIPGPLGISHPMSLGLPAPGSIVNPNSQGNVGQTSLGSSISNSLVSGHEKANIFGLANYNNDFQFAGYDKPIVNSGELQKRIHDLLLNREITPKPTKQEKN